MRNLTSGEVDEIVDNLTKGNKIRAIKLIRDATGRGLKESKDIIDQVAPYNSQGNVPTRSVMYAKLIAVANNYGVTASPEPMTWASQTSIDTTHELLRELIAAVKENTEILKDLAFERGD